ncbi:uncharacterized protein STEHIDRAFT_152778 [Stereum hirsutum FP-91666 SS1]|uniref:uncharacterized protein n=1 Tax=Stereum hirsutum (strain FP-91666) TaxID=721885 RepID=UPI000440BC3F|nr:uncharacterized protein STEHIDRAFT_152778 [Stereum hirsutum FP-91666 SS1]EIM91107.1 hypothetical protein STEHIDRAFT_152778 [Stereum hirsutum FP-91666 SS1]
MADPELPDYATTTAALPRPPPAPSPPQPPTPQRTPSNPCADYRHTYRLENSKGHPWLYLSLNSRAPDQKVSPLFFDGDKVEGQVGLNLQRTENIKFISITLCGGVTAVGQEEEVFLEETQILWMPSGNSSGRSPSKLLGKYTWPFSITFPSSVTAPSATKSARRYKRTFSANPPSQASTDFAVATSTGYPLPNSFSERASPVYVDYKLVVTVKKGYTMWSMNQTLTAKLAYLHRSIAEPPSTLCVLAYEDGRPPLGPEADPEGWIVFPPLNVSGTLFDTRPANVQYSLSVASPLSYAVDSPIPLLLTLKSSDSQALDLFTSPSATNSCLFLRRTVALGSHATDESVQARSNNTFTATVARAVFWPHEQGNSHEHPNDSDVDESKGGGVRSLRGEIYIAKSVKPSISFHRFSLRYDMVFIPPQATGFIPSAPQDEPLLAERVNISLSNAPGVQPRSHAPPGYTDPMVGDYNVTAGYLENGNQRFYHRHGFTTR